MEKHGPEYTRKALSEYYRQMPVEEIETSFRDMFDRSTIALKDLGEVVDTTITPIRPEIEDEDAPQAG